MRRALEQCRFILGKDRPGRWVALIALAVLVGLFEALGALMIFSLLKLMVAPEQGLVLPVIGDLRAMFPQAAEETLRIYFTISVAVFFLIRSGVILFNSYCQNRIAHNASSRLSSKLLSMYLSMPFEVHMLRNSAELIRNAHQSVTDVAQYVLIPAIAVASESLLLLGLVIVLLVTLPLQSAIAIFVLVPLVLLLLRTLQPRLRRLGSENQAASEASLRTLQQTLQGVADIKVSGRGEYFLRQFAKSRDDFARTSYIRATLLEAPRVTLESVLVLALVGFVVVGVAQGGSARSSVPVLALFGYAALRAMPAISKIVANLNNLNYGLAAIELIHADLAALTPPAHDLTQPMPDADRLTGDISFEDVSYRYPGGHVDVLSQVELTVPRGRSLGVVGPTGSGKTTMINLMLGLLAPTGGRVTVGGVDIATELARWQRSIGMVPQSVFLTDDSLRSNVAFGSEPEDIDDARLRTAARAAQLEDFVASLPAGWDTVVGDRGVRLSGGQRQRVAIARALYGEPDVLVLDEGTSALDRLTEDDLVAAVERLRGELTIVMVAHRLSTVRACDEIVLVVGGRIVDRGSFDDLAARNPQFKQMVR